MPPIIFKYDDVYQSVPKSLFCSGGNEMDQYKDLVDKWFSLPPKFSTVRVNSLLSTVQDVVDYINNLMSEQSFVRGLLTPDVCPHPSLPDCVVVSPHEVNALPRHQREVIVDAACGVAVLRGAHVFAPGVLAIQQSIQEGDEVSIYADSAGRCKRGLSVPFDDQGKVFVGNGIVKMGRRHLFEKDLHPKGVAVEVSETVCGVAVVNVPRRLGLLQNLPSIVCGHVLAPQPGDKVIDLCAAPGHKTTHLAALMNNQGVLVALDKVARKVDGLRTLCETMQADCVRAFIFDSTRALSVDPGPDWAPPFAAETFDCVLLDAPCTAMGQRPQIGSRLTTHEITSLPKLQRKLFSAAAELLRPGGSLVYSTCSLTTEENEDIVGWALLTFPRLQLVPALPRLGQPGVLQSKLSEAECQMVQRFGPPLGPTPEQDTIGFFIAKFIKNS